MPKPPKVQQDYSDEEVARRRDELLRRMLNTPPQPRKAKAAKAKRSPSKSGVTPKKS